MATIDQVIDIIPDAGHRGVDARTLFVTKQEAFQDALTDVFVPQINTFKTEANLLASEVNTLRDGTLALRNETENIRNLANTQTQAQVALATTQAGIATTKASEASSSANQALTYKNQLQGYVIPAGTSYNVEQLNTKYSAMTKAQFNALAEERKANRAGSGFDEWGKHRSGHPNINEGMWVSSTLTANAMFMGRISTDGGIGVSSRDNPIINSNGTLLKVINVANSSTFNTIVLPQAPNIYPYDTVLTAEQIASGVIKHADASNSGLIVNGKFDTDTSGWTAINGAILSTSNQRLRIAQTGTDYGGAKQTINVIAGKQYIMYIDIDNSQSIYNTYVTISGLLSSTTRIDISTGGLKRYTYTFTPTVTGNTDLAILLNSTVDGYIEFDNLAVYPADAISRSDLVFLESWHEDISEKNFIYPLGNVQYLGANTDGLTGIANGAFTGFETYSNFGVWQASSALIGKGYVWSSLTEAQKKAFIANPDNNCYLDGDKVIQVRYRVRVVQGVGDAWANTDATNPTTTGYGLMYSSTFKAVVKGKKVVSEELSTANTYYNKANSTYGLNADTGLFVSAPSTDFSYNTLAFALPIALVHRRNQGAYHPVYNPNGSKKASDNNFWYNTAVSFTSISDCFDPAKLLTVSGYIGSVSGRPDGLFYDQVHEGDITDLRNSSKKVEDYNRLISREFNKLVAGSTRGKEGEKTSTYCPTTMTVQLDTWVTITGFGATSRQVYSGASQVSSNVFYQTKQAGGIYDAIFARNTISGNVYKILGVKYYPNGTYIHFDHSHGTVFTDTTSTYDILLVSSTARTKSNTLLHCDIIGNPTNYPTAWKQSGVFGTPLIVAEDGTSLLPDGTKDTFKLSRKANATPLVCLRSTDNGATWTNFTPTFSTTTNEITLTDEPAGNLVMVYYQTHTSMAIPVANSEVLELGDVYGTFSYQMSYLSNSLIGKTLIGDGSINKDGYVKLNSLFIARTDRKLYTGVEVTPTLHNSFNFSAYASPAVKVLPYLTRTNGKAYLNLVFKEMKHNGTSWGDSNTFNIVDNVSTTTDNNAQIVLIGQKTVELPYFIANDE